MIQLRKLTLDDLEAYEYWKLPTHKYHELNGPYFKKKNSTEIKKQIQTIRDDLLQEKSVLDNVRIISNETNELIGEVSWYWRSQETNWLEVGIVIFNDQFWGKGIGAIALELWIDEVFKEKPALVRIGLTTWSGNQGMIQLAKKIGLREEARYRNARIVNGKYFDSVSYGILKKEWENR
ncbi:GNAT family N-acetyltransferase [Tenacibaculum amylolyticum]|uniref:GNAT family N-acetyltransferase n=1 Tax=Tenacibaculum amylolyticum TaxID=104269 RepID=UPI0038955B5C